MLIRERLYEKCQCCGDTKMVKDESHGCDQCRKVIDHAKNQPYHDLTVFHETDANTHHIFCSVGCVVKWLRAFKPMKGYRFMSLPLFSGAAKLRELQRHLK